jgi:hypothetical protein
MASAVAVAGSLQLAKSNRSITTVMTPPRRRMLAFD